MVFDGTKLIRSALLLLLAAPVSASFVNVVKTTGGWQLMVDSQPYFIRGISYVPDVVGEDPNIANYRDWMVVDDNHNGKIDGPYDSWVDANFNNVQNGDEPTVGDFQLMKNINTNTIRIYHHPSDDPAVEACYPASTNPEGNLIWNHALNKTLLRDLFNTYGIRVAMGDEIGDYAGSSCAPWIPGTDYTDPIQIASMTTSVIAMVNDSKNEPWLLMYVLGNENNYPFTHTNASTQPQAYYTFVGQMVDLIHHMDPQHPVAISNGETQFLSYAKTYAPHLDIFGVNSYRNPGTFTGFGTLWNEIAAVWDIPVLITEYGLIDVKFSGLTYDQQYQSANLASYWCDISNHQAGYLAPGNSIGGFNYEWVDSWWQNGDPNNIYNLAGSNLENSGLFTQGSGQNSIYERQTKSAYSLYQALWAPGTNVCPCATQN